MLTIVYAGYLVDNMRLGEWGRVQTDPELAKCFSEARYVPLVALRHYLRLKNLTKHIGLMGIPYPKGKFGEQDGDNWYLMFYRRHGEHRVPLRQFSGWEEYQEQEEDLKYKEFVKTMCAREPGLEMMDWKVVAWVGKIGVFYDFSEEVVAGICDRAEAARAERLKNAAPDATQGDLRHQP